ncbi:MAG: MBL fold metallo-hydrolase [Alphaproteobacteria bacterium]|nr:MBL fold metallo-hydrolase [Alphaproteobacteria bacterium]
MGEQPDFDRNMPAAGRIERLSPIVQRVIAPNPGPFTFTGTCTYIVGDRDMIVIDPGPDDLAHRDLIMKAIGTSRLNAILVTHTHRDHSPLANTLKTFASVPLMGCGPHQLARALNDGEINPLDASSDYDYQPDRILNDNDHIHFGDIEIQVVATPGHTINHLAFALINEKALFSGDHVMGWSTSIVAPPDGAMQPYLRSLEKLIARDDQVYYPGHGEAVRNPSRFVPQLLAHRRLRETSILDSVREGVETIPELVTKLYRGLDPRLYGAAGLSVFAHLEDLVSRGLVQATPTLSLTAKFLPR